MKPKFKVGEVARIKCNPGAKFHILEIITITCTAGTQVYYKGRIHWSTMPAGVGLKTCEVNEIELIENEGE